MNAITTTFQMEALLEQCLSSGFGKNSGFNATEIDAGGTTTPSPLNNADWTKNVI
jgi:hypothetical protein